VLKEWSSLKLRKAWRRVTGKQPRPAIAACTSAKPVEPTRAAVAR